MCFYYIFTAICQILPLRQFHFHLFDLPLQLLSPIWAFPKQQHICITNKIIKNSENKASVSIHCSNGFIDIGLCSEDIKDKEDNTPGQRNDDIGIVC